MSYGYVINVISKGIKNLITKKAPPFRGDNTGYTSEVQIDYGTYKTFYQLPIYFFNYQLYNASTDNRNKNSPDNGNYCGGNTNGNESDNGISELCL